MSATAENLPAQAVTAQQVRDDDEIDLLEYWNILVERKWLVAGIAVGILAIALVVTLLATPIYRAGTTLQIERDTMKVTSFEGVAPVESPADRDFYQTQYELLQSRSLATRVVQDLRLVEHPHYAKAVAALDERLEERAAPPEGRQQARERMIAGQLLEALTIEPVRNSRLVKVNFDSPDPQLAARIANAWAEAYIQSNLERRFEAASYATEYLEERLAQLKARLEDSERAVVDFSAAEEIISVGEGTASLSAQNLSQLNAALATAQDKRIQAEAKWLQASTGNPLGLPQVLASSIVQSLREKRADLIAQYQQNLGTYKPDYPDMVRLRGQVEELDAQIDAEVGNIRDGLRAEYEAARAQETLLREQMNQVTGDVLDLQGRSIQYNILRREADTNREIYDALLQRYKEIGVAGGVGANNMSVIDRALVPNGRHSPRLPLNLAIGLMLGLMLGVLAAFVLHFLDRTVKTPAALRQLIARPVLGVVPKLPEGTSPAQAAKDLRSAFSEAYRSVRTALQFATPHGLPRTMLITSANPTEGKTTTAVELARNIAQMGKRVALVDADLRNPSLHKVFGLANGSGLSSVLAGALDGADALQASKGELAVPGLSIIPSGPIPPSPPELLAGERMPALLARLAEQFDVVVLDGPPVLGLADAPLLAHQAEATVLVATAEQTRSDSLKVAEERLVAARGHVLGTLLTRFDLKRHGEGYGYTYYSYGDAGR